MKFKWREVTEKKGKNICRSISTLKKVCVQPVSLSLGFTHTNLSAIIRRVAVHIPNIMWVPFLDCLFFLDFSYSIHPIVKILTVHVIFTVFWRERKNKESGVPYKNWKRVIFLAPSKYVCAYICLYIYAHTALLFQFIFETLPCRVNQ